MSSLFITLFSLLCFFSIGLLIANFLVGKNHLPKEMIFVGAIGCVALLYYSLFFLFILNFRLGYIANIFSHGLGMAAILYFIYCYSSQKKQNPHIIIPSILTLLFFCLYSTALTGCRLSTYSQNAQDNLGYCELSGLPIDNSLPYTFAANVKDNLAKNRIGDWRLVDRPPIQIGAALSVGQFTSNKNASYEAYQYLAIFLQLSWIGVIYGFLALAGIKLKNILLILMLSGFNGFIFINSIYVWPKLLAASLMLAGLALILISKKNKVIKYLPLSMAFFALALLTHGGVLFTLIGAFPLLLYIIFRHNNRKQMIKSLRYGTIGIALFLVILFPWLFYKNSNSQSDRLVKWHIAGVISAQDERSTLSTIKDSYSTLTLNAWGKSKFKNVEAILFPINTDSDNKSLLSTMSSWVRTNQFFIMIVAIGLFNIGWLELFFRKYRKSINKFEVHSFLVVLFSTIVYIFAMFKGGGTVLHQGSYATMLLLYSILGVALSRLGSKVLSSLVVLQVIIFYIVWVYDIYKKSEAASLYLLMEFGLVILIPLVGYIPVSYTHLTLPTKRIV